MKKKSLALNTILYTIKLMMSMLFPLITFPYISRILMAEGIGKYNFSSSYVSYFTLIAGLGIATYAIREGAKIRDSRESFENFANEMFSINLISTFIALILLVGSIFVIPKLSDYRLIIITMAMAIPLTMVGTDWVFSIYEDFAYITIRSIAFQFISMILMFCLIKDSDDVELYALISVLATAGSNVLNYSRAGRYFRHRPVFNNSLKKHLKPILILFASSIASQIYINADTTMLGFMQGDYDTGIYSAAAKIYNIIRLLMSAIITILLPRLAYIRENEGYERYEKDFSKFFCGYMSVVIPMSVGLFCISKEAILILSGDDFVIATDSLKVLCGALMFSSLGSFIANTVLIIYGKEKLILKATITGAVINILGNIYMIHAYSYLGAAITTIASELIVFAIQLYEAKKSVSFRGFIKDILKVLAGCVAIIAVCYGIQLLSLPGIIQMILQIISAGVAYTIVMIIVRQTFVCETIDGVISKIKKK